METLNEINFNARIVIMLLLVSVPAIYLAYVAIKDKELDIKLFISLMTIIISAIMVVQIYSSYRLKREIISTFKNNKELVCQQGDKYIVISKKRGYRFQSEFFTKEGKAFSLNQCGKL